MRRRRRIAEGQLQLRFLERRPYPIQPLEHIINTRAILTGRKSAKGITSISNTLGIQPQRVRLYRDIGLTALQADHYANKLNKSPYDIWPNYGHDE
jgi:hypothetical protein